MEGCLMKWLFFRLNVDHPTNLKQSVVDRSICTPTSYSYLFSKTLKFQRTAKYNINDIECSFLMDFHKDFQFNKCPIEGFSTSWAKLT